MSLCAVGFNLTWHPNQTNLRWTSVVFSWPRGSEGTGPAGPGSASASPLECLWMGRDQLLYSTNTWEYITARHYKDDELTSKTCIVCPESKEQFFEKIVSHPESFTGSSKSCQMSLPSCYSIQAHTLYATKVKTEGGKYNVWHEGGVTEGWRCVITGWKLSSIHYLANNGSQEQVMGHIYYL